ncbi:MAG TPA: TolC family protein [Bacteroidales bacterium]|nr:TolC family protein [Bacteroidales bacterium]
MRKFAIIFLCIWTFSNSFSQNAWTLERCIDHAIENNIQVKNQELNTQINDYQLQQSKLGILPGINLGASENFRFGRSVDPYTYEFETDNFSSANFQVSSSVTLFSGLRQYNSVKKAEIDQEAGYVLLDQTKNNIMLAVASAYLNVLYAMDLLEIAIQQRNITALQLERTNILVSSGSVPMQNKYELEAQFANEELNIVNYENQLNLATLNLAQLIEITDLSAFTIVRPDIENIITESGLMTVEEIYSKALENMPQIEYAGLNYLSAEKNLAISRGAYLPNLSLSASFGSGYSSSSKLIDGINMGTPYISGFATDNVGNILDVYQYSYDYNYIPKPFNDQVRDNTSTALTFNLSIPVFNGLQTRTGVNNSKIYLEQSKLQVEQAKKDLLKEIQQAYSDSQSAIKKYAATEKALISMQLSFDYTQKRYEEGLINTTDYNIAKNNLARTQAELIRAKYDVLFKQKILDFYIGLPIRL